MSAYYNERDPIAAQWLRNLIDENLIAQGHVDERSIEDVRPVELAGYTQCHFFAGIGGWSVALRLAGWPDDRHVWTGSCPCQPFSQAGKGGGFADERHLWPHFHWLIGQCTPAVVIGEQVASKDGLAWFDLVRADMEAEGYAVGAADLCAAGVGAPHIRQRLFWVADASGTGLEGSDEGPLGRERATAERGSSVGRLANGSGQRRDGIGLRLQPRRPRKGDAEAGRSGETGGVADHLMQQRPDGEPGICLVDDAGGRLESSAAATGLCGDLRPSPTNGYWADADWLFCRDGRWRPVEPGTFPLAHGVHGRVGLLRGYGNAIVPRVAQAVIEAFMECHP